MQTTVEGQIASNNYDVANIKSQDDKTLAKLSWLRIWPKNPKTAEEKDLKRLKKQIQELGVYKPLVITPDGEILGGNQRYKVLNELVKEDARFEWVWVSVVEAWTDAERLKYALSDNDNVGKYTKEKLDEVLAPFLKQGSLFKDYGIEISNPQTIDKFLEDITLTEQEMQFKGIKQSLKAMGINDETVNALEMMTTFSKTKEDLPDVDLKGCIVGQKFPLLFWFDDEILYNQMKEIFTTGYKDKHNTAKLMEITEKFFEKKLPTTNDELENIIKEVRKLKNDIAYRNEIKESTEKQEKRRAELIEEFNKLTNEAVPQFPI